MSEEKPEDPPAAAAQEATEDKEDEDSSPPAIDLTHHDIKPDMFEGIADDKLASTQHFLRNRQSMQVSADTIEQLL